MASITWLGHGSFRLDTSDGKRVYVDPWLTGPTCPDAERTPERGDVIAVTHGHFDHSVDALGLATRLGCPVIAQPELVSWFQSKGLPEAQAIGMNKGGTAEVAGIRFTMTHAMHSSSTPDGGYAGEPTGFVIASGDDRVYFSGDTAVFGDMALIARLYRPTVAVLAIGDVYTMGPAEAAVALELLGNPRCIPGHWDTFPALTGTPQALAQLTSAEVEDIAPGDTVEL